LSAARVGKPRCSPTWHAIIAYRNGIVLTPASDNRDHHAASRATRSSRRAARLAADRQTTTPYLAGDDIERDSFDHLFGNPAREGKSWQWLDPSQDPVTFEKILPTHRDAFASFVVLRRETVLKVGRFDEDLRLLEFYHYWLKFLYRDGRMAYLRRVLGKRRIHRESLTYNQDVVVPHAINALRKLQGILRPGTKRLPWCTKKLPSPSQDYA
jgi:hypothetical protein